MIIYKMDNKEDEKVGEISPTTQKPPQLKKQRPSMETIHEEECGSTCTNKICFCGRI